MFCKMARSRFYWVQSLLNLIDLWVSNRQKLVFLCVGLISVFVDITVYLTLLEYMHYSHAWSKTLGFFSGAIFSYFANKTLTFGHKKKYFASASKFAILYATSLCVNVLVNEIMIAVLGVTDFLILVAFIFATAASTIMNYLGMRYIVFKN